METHHTLKGGSSQPGFLVDIGPLEPAGIPASSATFRLGGDRPVMSDLPDDQRRARFGQPSRTDVVVIDLLARAPRRTNLGGARLQAIENADRPLQGILFCVLGLACFASQDVLIKLMSGSFPLWQLAFIRGVVVLGIMWTILSLTRGTKTLLTRRLRPHLLRGGLAVLSYTTYYSALSTMPLVEGGALYASAPLFVTLFSVLFLGENVGWRRTTAVSVGFVGVLIMLRPGADVFQPMALLCILSAALYAYSTTVTRSLGRTESAATITVYSNMVYIVVSGFMLCILAFIDIAPSDNIAITFLTSTWQVPTLQQLGLILLSGVLATGGFFSIAKAYAASPVSQVAPFEYSYLLWGLILGFLVWQHVPNLTTVIGAAVVIGSGIYIIKRESVLTSKTLKTG